MGKRFPHPLPLPSSSNLDKTVAPLALPATDEKLLLLCQTDEDTGSDKQPDPGFSFRLQQQTDRGKERRREGEREGSMSPSLSPACQSLITPCSEPVIKAESSPPHPHLLCNSTCVIAAPNLFSAASVGSQPASPIGLRGQTTGGSRVLANSVNDPSNTAHHQELD
ncbi:unnamed protein product [Pleuronectes platessa]|uniref:Uncharacterized protein n=1 Tax=Pleuronectes platessa TaxID=8262 RepID=A0A9N7TIW6_PLEPL|nr:unnamed protein product [Pleuronectes platessa]